MVITHNLQEKLDKLINFLKDYRVIIAFSGGVDSSLLSYITKQHAKEMLAVFIESILNPFDELHEARIFAERYRIPLKVIKNKPLENENFIKNPPNRCYICKKAIFSSILKVKDELSFDIIIDGSNIDDLADYRPGLQALNDMSVISPYIKFNINKQEIRELSKHFSLEIHSMPSMACLASRIPFNEEITEKKLNMIKQGENYLKDAYGLKQLRVRLHEGFLARIEAEQKDIPRIISQKSMETIVSEFKKLGFCFVTIDLEGFRSGSLNESLKSNTN